MGNAHEHWLVALGIWGEIKDGMSAVIDGITNSGGVSLEQHEAVLGQLKRLEDQAKALHTVLEDHPPTTFESGSTRHKAALQAASSLCAFLTDLWDKLDEMDEISLDDVAKQLETASDHYDPTFEELRRPTRVGLVRGE
jgi:hypothetical protein